MVGRGRSYFSLIFAVTVCAVSAIDYVTYFDTYWSYDITSTTKGPSTWFYYCKGPYQSPVNVVKSKATLVSSKLSPVVITSRSKHPIRTELYNPGHAIEMYFTFSGSIPTITGGPFEADVYELKKAMIIWGGGHTINYKKFDGEFQLVWRNKNQPNDRQPDAYATLAYMMSNNGRVPDVVRPLWSAMNYVRLRNSTYPTAPNLSIDELIGTNINSPMYSYPGSFTYLWCEEFTKWMIVDAQFQLNPKELTILKKTQDNNRQVVGYSNRPLQTFETRAWEKPRVLSYYTFV